MNYLMNEHWRCSYNSPWQKAPQGGLMRNNLELLMVSLYSFGLRGSKDTSKKRKFLNSPLLRSSNKHNSVTFWNNNFPNIFHKIADQTSPFLLWFITQKLSFNGNYLELYRYRFEKVHLYFCQSFCAEIAVFHCQLHTWNVEVKLNWNYPKIIN